MTIDTGFETIEFYRSFDTPKPLTFSSREDAFAWLNRLCSGNGNSASRFRQLLTQYTDGSAVVPLSGDATVQQLADLIYKRRIVVFRKIRFAVAGSVGKKKEEESAPAIPLAGHKRTNGNIARSKTWVSIVLNDSDGNPEAGESYRIELPDGRVVASKLDRLAAVSGIDFGQCKVYSLGSPPECGSPDIGRCVYKQKPSYLRGCNPN